MTRFAHLFGFYVWNWVWTWDILTSQHLAIINQICLLPTPPPSPPNHICLKSSAENVILQLRKHCWVVTALCLLFDYAPFWHDDELIVAYLAQGFRAFSGIGTVHYTFHRSASIGCYNYVVSSRTVSWKACFGYRPSYTSACKEVSFIQVFDWTSIYVCLSPSRPCATHTECSVPYVNTLIQWNLPITEPQATGIFPN